MTLLQPKVAAQPRRLIEDKRSSKEGIRKARPNGIRALDLKSGDIAGLSPALTTKLELFLAHDR